MNNEHDAAGDAATPGANARAALALPAVEAALKALVADLRLPRERRPDQGGFPMAYTIGHKSGCHLNPAVTVGLVSGERFPAAQVLPDIMAQVAGAVIGAGVLYAIASGAPGFDLASGFASNGYGEHSPGKCSMMSALVAEVVLTMMVLLIVMGSTHGKAPAGFAPLAIALTLIHLISIPLTNTSANPARSTGPALFVGGWALSQLWLFWVAPLVGGALGGVLSRWLVKEPSADIAGDAIPVARGPSRAV